MVEEGDDMEGFLMEATGGEKIGFVAGRDMELRDSGDESDGEEEQFDEKHVEIESSVEKGEDAENNANEEDPTIPKFLTENQDGDLDVKEFPGLDQLSGSEEEEQDDEELLKETLENNYNGLNQDEEEDAEITTVDGALTTDQLDAILNQHLRGMGTEGLKILSKDPIKEVKHPIPEGEEKPDIEEFVAPSGGKIIIYHKRSARERVKKEGGAYRAYINEQLREIEELEGVCPYGEAAEPEEEEEGDEKVVDLEFEDSPEVQQMMADLGMDVAKVKTQDNRNINPYTGKPFGELLTWEEKEELVRNLPDYINGEKVYKKEPIPELPFEEDIAAQEALEREKDEFERETEENPPAIFEASDSLKEPILSYIPKIKVVTKQEAVEGANLIKEKRQYKTKNKPKKYKEAVKSRSSSSGSDAPRAELKLKRSKVETKSQRRIRKELVKKLKEERKSKKHQFKENFELAKKSYISQHSKRVETHSLNGLSVHKID